MNRESLPGIPAAGLALIVACGIGLSSGAQLRLASGSDQLASEIAEQVKREETWRIAVLPFRELHGEAVDLGIFLSEDLTSRLLQHGVSEIVERSQIDRLLEEMDLAEKGLIESETAQHIARLAGADVVVTGTLTCLPSYLVVNCRIIQVETGRIVGGSQIEILKDADVMALWNRSCAYPGERQGPQTAGRAHAVRDEKPEYVTDSYSLTIDSVEIRGSTVALELSLKSEIEEIYRFRMSHPYLLDSGGIRLDLAGSDSGDFIHGVELLPHSTLRSRFLFCATDIAAMQAAGYAPPSAGFCLNKKINDDSLTFAADDHSGSLLGRKIIMHTH